MTKLKSKEPGAEDLLTEIRALIAAARRQTTITVNMAVTLLYWRIGQRIHLVCLVASALPMVNKLSLHCRENW
jgi:hypothetical protein